MNRLKLKIQKLRASQLGHMIAINDQWIPSVEKIDISVEPNPKVTITFTVDSIESLPDFLGKKGEWFKENFGLEDS
jgi:hypothetical protein